MNRLSAKQEQFCIEIAKGENQTQAALKAGYSPKIARAQACANMTKRNIIERIKELSARKTKRAIMSIDERQETLSRIAQSEEQDTHARIKAIETLNKMDGVYINKTELTGKDSGPLVIKWEE